MLAILMLALVQTAEEGKLKLPVNQPVFAIAKTSQNGLSIAINFGTRGPMRQETYAVNVPVTEMRRDKDGNERQVTVMRRETRTRMVRVGGPSRMVAQTYTVMVPVQKELTDKDGNTKRVTVQVPETRTRMVRVSGGPSNGKPKIYKIAKCKIVDLNGNAVDAKEVAKRLSKSSPVVLLYGNQKLDPFYKVALNQKTLLITPPAPKPKRATESTTGELSEEEYEQKMKEAEARAGKDGK